MSGPRPANADQEFEGAPGDFLREILALLLIGLCLYSLLSMATLHLPDPSSVEVPRGGMINLGGTFGYYLAHAGAFLFGYASWLLVLLALVSGMLLFLGRPVPRPVIKALGAVVFTAVAAIWLAGPTGADGMSQLAPYGAGGRLGAALSPQLAEGFGGPGRLLLLAFGALTSLLLTTEALLSSLVPRSYDGLERAWGSLRRWAEARSGRRTLEGGRGGSTSIEDPDDEGYVALDEAEVDEAEVGEAEVGEAEVGEKDVDHGEVPGEEADPQEIELLEDEGAEPEEGEPEGVEVDEAEVGKSEPVRVIRPARRRRKRAQGVLPFQVAYSFPPLELFREPTAADHGATKAMVRRNSEAIASRLASFKIDAEVVGVSMGPAVTQYEVRLGEGVRVGRVVSFEADLAAALKAVSVRVVAPIPGRDTIGVEVPNQDRQLVVLRELLEQFGTADDLAIPLFLGRDVAGQPIVEDLADMPHLLIAGTTGSGKSVCLNAILLSILMTRSPAQVRFILVDPKMVELQFYKTVPHLCCDVVTNMKKAPAVLEWAVGEMERRYTILNSVGVNHISAYNRLGAAELERRLSREVEADESFMPHVVLVIDELADLMAVAQKEVEDSIQRLAQKSRSVGMHVIIATQRPSTDVITGVIKANLPCQIAFKVNRKVDSRVILDMNGAEKLLGHGDMLYVPPRTHRVVRVQGTFVSDEEIRRVVDYLGEHGPKPVYLRSLVQSETGHGRRPQDRDNLYADAAEVVLGQQRGSATLLQRALAVGYTRATRLLEMMEEDGLVGGFNGSRSRDVMLTLEEWREREAAIEAELEADEERVEADADDVCESALDSADSE